MITTTPSTRLIEKDKFWGIHYPELQIDEEEAEDGNKGIEIK